MQIHQTPFSRYRVRSRIGALAARLPAGSAEQAKVESILRGLDGTATEQETAFALREVVSRSVLHSSASVRQAAKDLEDGLESASHDPAW